jgi:PAS domain S-box-containing protein
MNKRQLNTLLIDDDEQEFTMTRDLLGQIDGWQFKLEWVSSYEAALAKMEQDPYDICLLNCRLEDHQGLEFLQRATKNGATTSLILLADPDDRQTAIAGLESGAVDYLVKGQIDAPGLERSIRYAIGYKRLKESLEKRVNERTERLATENGRLRQTVAEYEQQEQLFRESERQYRMLFNVDIYGVEVLDNEGRITDCNPAFLNLLGFSGEALIGRHVSTYTAGLSATAFDNILAELNDQGYTEGERELVCQDGSTTLVWSRSRAVHDESGEFIGIVTFSRDITERMKAVKQISTLARALEQSPIATTITDVDGNIEYTNFEFTELTGYGYEDVTGQHLADLKLGSQSPENFKAFLEVISAGDSWVGELHNQNLTGRDYWTSVTVTPMFDAKGSLTHSIIIQEDITARKVGENEAMRAHRRIGTLMTDHIGDLTTTNERLQREITERKRAERALERSRSRLEAQYKGIPVPTYTWELLDDDFVLVDYNHAAEIESDGRIADFKNGRAGAIFKDRPQVLGDFLRCSIEKTIVKREAPYKKVTTGETRHFVTTYNYVQPNLIIVHIQDITEYKELEAEWRRCRQQLDALSIADDTELNQVKEALGQEIAEREKIGQALSEAEERIKKVTSNIDEKLREQYRSIPVPTYSWQMIGGEFVLVDFNDAAAEVMGRIVDFYGKTASDVFQERPQVLADFSRCFQAKATVKREAPYKLITTGETRFFVTTYNFVPPTLIIVHILDITDQKRMEAELITCHQKLKALAAEHDGHPATKQLLLQPGASPSTAGFEEEVERLVNERTIELSKVNRELERKLVGQERAAESFRQSRARLRAQYTGLPIPTYSWQRMTQDFVLIDYNNAAEKATQRRLAEYMGKSAGELFKDRPEVVADLMRCYTEKMTVIREGNRQPLTTDESRIFVTTYSYIPPNLVILYVEDITERKQTEELLRRGEEQVELVCRLSPDTTLTFVNDAYCWYFNRRRQKLIGQKLPFIYEEDIQKVKIHFASLRQESPVGTIEYRVVKPNGDLRWQQWVNQTVFDDKGYPVEIRAVGRDITRRKERQ